MLLDSEATVSCSVSCAFIRTTKFTVRNLFRDSFQVIAILDKLKAEKGSSDGGNEGVPEPSDSQEDDQDWDVDDPEEDIIYVK